MQIHVAANKYECAIVHFRLSCLQSQFMAVASGPAGPVFTVIFGTAHAQIMNNE